MDLVFSLELVKERFIEIATAPLEYPDMKWIVIPLLLTLTMMEFYFSRYKKEELGWNTAFGNSMVLIFVSMDLFKFLYTNGMLEYVTPKNALAIGVMIAGLILTITTYFHTLPKNVAFGLSSRFPMNIIAYLTIILVYSTIPIELNTIIASFIFIICLALLLKILDALVPLAYEYEGPDEEEEI